MGLLPTVPTLRGLLVMEIKAAMNPGDPSKVTSVHRYRRFWRDTDKFNSLFKRPSDDLNPGIINGWMVTRTRCREFEIDERWRFYNLHRMELHGYAVVQDSGFTEEVFDDQIEAIRDRLRLNLTIFGDTERTSPISQLEQITPVAIGNVTAWYALISVEPEAIETKTI